MRNLLLFACATLLVACSFNPTILPVEGSYEPEWASLEKHEAVPDWMRDAKMGPKRDEVAARSARLPCCRSRRTTIAPSRSRQTASN